MKSLSRIISSTHSFVNANLLFLGQLLVHLLPGVAGKLEDEFVGNIAVKTYLLPVLLVAVIGRLHAAIPFTEFDSPLCITFHHNNQRFVEKDTGKDLILQPKGHHGIIIRHILRDKGQREAVCAKIFYVHVVCELWADNGEL